MDDDRRELILAMATAMRLVLTVDSDAWKTLTAAEQIALNNATMQLDTLTTVLEAENADDAVIGAS